MTQFFYGTLCHLPLLEAVLGHPVVVQPATLPDHAVYWVAGQAYPTIVAQSGSVAHGLVLRDPSDEDQARLDYYEGGFAYDTRTLAVTTPLGPLHARVYFSQDVQQTLGAPWMLADWVAHWGAIVTSTARDVMALRGQRDPAAVVRRYGPMLVRGGSRLRAAEAAPTTLRRQADPSDVQIATQRQPYAHFFAVEEYDLRYRRFDGSFSAQINRAVFVSGDAVTVLPYDPVRDRILLIEQFRVGPMGRGDAQPWLLEAIAGRIDPGETPEDAARREAVEEAGLTLGALLPIGNYYPSPGAKTEYIYSYLALCDLPDGAAGVFGELSEAEDIRGHLLGFDAFMALVNNGEVNNAPLLLTALWLQRERGRLRAAAHQP